MKKVLFTYIGGGLAGTKPLSISLLSAILKARGHKTVLFDTTFMDLGFMLDGEISDHVKQNKKVYWDKYSMVRDKSVDPKRKFAELVEKERPDVIGANATADMYSHTIDFLRYIKARFDIPVIIGGIQAVLLPDEVIAEDCIDAICVGEGEKAIVEFVDSIENGRITRTDIADLWIKKDGKVHKNALGPLVDVNDLPFLDYSIYDERQFLKPYEGKILRSGDIQDVRGCPKLCAYCANAVLNRMYAKNRVRPFAPERFVEEAEYLVKTYKLEFFKIFSEDMFLRNEDDLARLSELYKKRVNVPFTSHGHPNTVTEKKAKLIKNMNCASISMALESGNYEYRRTMLKRGYTNEEYIRKIRILKEAGIRTVSLNMMGLPHETEKMIFDTFRVLRKAKPTVANISMFFPYRGILLGDLCVRENFVTVEKVKQSRCDMSKTILVMPQISAETLNGIRKMAHYYINYPVILYPIFRLCQKDNGLGKTLLKCLDWFDGKIQAYTSAMNEGGSVSSKNKKIKR